MFDAISIPNIFKELVETEVSALLGYDVQFRFGSLQSINKELSLDSTRFPLIALINGWKETSEVDGILALSDMRLLIAVRSQETSKSQHRNDNVYIPFIYPIYNALCAAIANCRSFNGYNTQFKHTVVDWPNMQLETGEQLFEDCVDGRVLDNIELKVNKPMCTATKPICSYTPCPNGAELETFTIFKRVVFTGIWSSVLEISVEDHQHYVAPPAFPAPFLPQVSLPNSGIPSFTMASLYEAIDMSAVPNGEYIGRLSFGYAQVEFYYKINKGKVISMTNLIKSNAEINFDCQSYYDNGGYAIEVSFLNSMETEDIESIEVTLFDGITDITQLDPLTKTVELTVNGFVKFDSSVETINHIVGLVTDYQQENKIHLITKCKN